MQNPYKLLCIVNNTSIKLSTLHEINFKSYTILVSIAEKTYRAPRKTVDLGAFWKNVSQMSQKRRK